MAGKVVARVIAGAALVVAMSSVVQAQTVRAVSTRQDVAASRTGRLPGLGAVSAVLGWDRRMQVTLRDEEFVLTRSFTPATREVEITIEGPGEKPLTLRFGGTEGFFAARGSRVVRGTGNPDAIRRLLAGRAVAALREHIGNYERQLNASTVASRPDDPHAYGFLLAGALVASLDGDPNAVGRARDAIKRRVAHKMRAARFEFKNCVTEYERYLLQIDTDRTNCLEAANGRDSWWVRAADRLGCEIEFMAAALAGEGQFAGCTALGALLR